MYTKLLSLLPAMVLVASNAAADPTATSDSSAQADGARPAREAITTETGAQARSTYAMPPHHKSHHSSSRSSTRGPKR